MIKTSARRFALTISFSALTLLATGSSFAQTVVGTDPCPKGLMCTASSSTATPKTATTAPSPTATSTSTSGTLVQALMVLLGVA